MINDYLYLDDTMDGQIKILKQYRVESEKNGKIVEEDIVEIERGNMGIVYLKQLRYPNMPSTCEGWITGSDGRIYIMKVEKDKVIAVKEVNKMY